jgi:YVTN family beta-propeller protein
MENGNDINSLITECEQFFTNSSQYSFIMDLLMKGGGEVRKARLFLLILGLFLVYGCEKATFPAVPKRPQILISVNVNDESVEFFDAKTGSALAEWKVKKPIQGAALLRDQRTLLLYGNELDRVYLYDIKTGKATQEWQTGKGIVHALVSNKGDAVFLADDRQNAIRIFKENGQEAGKIAVGDKPLTLLQNDAGTLLYVIDFRNTKAYIVQVDKRRVVRTFSVPKFAVGGLLREEEGELWIGGHGSGNTVETNIHIYSASTGALVKTVKAPVMPVDFAETKEGIYALSHGSSTLRKWDDSGKLESSVIVGANPFTMIGANERLYIASYDSDEIYVVDERTMKIIARWKTGKGPFQLLMAEGE